jgi:ATP-dependent protease ClpP protease subunit
MSNDVYRPGMRRSWFNLAYSEETKTADIYIYNDIGYFGVSANDFKEQLLSVNAGDLNIYINSMGGEVGDGMAIYNILKRHQGKKTVHIDGMAASIASVIAMAGDEIIMPETALMFLHQPWTMTAGNADDLQRTAEHLNKTEAAIIAAYTAKTGRDAALIAQMLKDETTLSAQEAIDLGFATALAKEEPATEFAFAGAMMNRVLCQMAKKLTKEKNMADEPAVETPAADPVAEPVAEVTSEPAAEPTPEVAAEPEPVVDARAEFKSFVARFGADRAARYFETGLSFADAEKAYVSELEAENAALKASVVVTAPEPVRPVAVVISDPVKQLSFEEAYALAKTPKDKREVYLKFNQK